jgi:hypothetical protein
MLTNRQFTTDLNLKVGHKVSAALLFFFLGCVLLAFQTAWSLIPGLLSLIVLLFLNYDFYGFFFKKRGRLFTLKVIPFHLLYYLYSSLGFFIGYCKYYLDKNTVIRSS